MKDDRLYLIHIRECIERIESYLRETDRETFMQSSLLQDAIIRNLQVMAESTQRLSDAIKEKQPEVQWYRIAGFRNVLVHDYLGLDLEKVWNIIVKELPPVKEVVTAPLE